MENITGTVIKHSLLNSIEREKLLLEKYKAYNTFIKNKETKELLEEFQSTAREHIALLKEKIQKIGN